MAALLKLSGRHGALWQSRPATQKDGAQLVVGVHKSSPDQRFTAVALSPRGDLLAAVDSTGGVFVLHLSRRARAVAAAELAACAP